MRLGCGAHTVHLVSMDILFDHAAHSGDFLQIYISIQLRFKNTLSCNSHRPKYSVPVSNPCLIHESAGSISIDSRWTSDVQTGGQSVDIQSSGYPKENSADIIYPPDCLRRISTADCSPRLPAGCLPDIIWIFARLSAEFFAEYPLNRRMSAGIVRVGYSLDCRDRDGAGNSHLFRRL